MKIVVIGGTGLIGSKTVAILRQRGHEVVAASPNTGVNTITGAGLREAMAGTQVVIDLANSPSFEDKAVPQPSRGGGRSRRPAPCRALHRRNGPDAQRHDRPHAFHTLGSARRDCCTADRAANAISTFSRLAQPARTEILVSNGSP